MCLDDAPAKSGNTFEARRRNIPARPVRRQRPLLLLTTGVIALATAQPAIAQTVNWTGSTDADWDTASNWDTNAVPVAGDEVVIDDLSINTPMIGSAVNAQASSILVGELAEGLLHIANGGTLTTTAPSIAGWAPGSKGLITVAGLDAQWNSGNTIVLGYQGKGSLSIGIAGHVVNNGPAMLGFLADGDGLANVNGADAS